jgi:hypothetical protein
MRQIIVNGLIVDSHPEIYHTKVTPGNRGAKWMAGQRNALSLPLYR